MNTKYEPVIGLEIHIQAKTKSKMFSRVSADYFGKEANSNVDPVSLGLPGALPVPNKQAVELSLKLCLAMNCSINMQTWFDRKNYFYPDLPKGYQISQYDHPMGYKGYLDLNADGSNKINITRIHLEEDTGKSIHENGNTYLDFNKAGVPLIEVVTEPEFKSGEQIDLFAKRLRQIVRLLKVSDGDMEKGQMRYELNISLRKPGETALPKYKVEVKNIGSISLLQKVTEYEITRQAEILDKGEVPVQETRGTRDMTGKTHSQRVKEDAADYRYFPEPDIPPLTFSEEYISSLRAGLPKLPKELLAEYKALGINDELAAGIVSEEERIEFLNFYTEQKLSNEIVGEIAKLLMGEISATAVTEGKSLADLVVNKEILISLSELRLANKLTSSNFKQAAIALIKDSSVSALTLNDYLTKQGLLADSSMNLDELINQAIATDPAAKEKFAKNPNIAMYFVGQVMKASKGTANAADVKKLVEAKLAN